MAVPPWQKLRAGVYFKEKPVKNQPGVSRFKLLVVPEEALKASGIPDTPANRAALTAQVARLWRKCCADLGLPVPEGVGGVCGDAN